MAKIALLIGISEYTPEFAPLPGTATDVAAMKRVLEDGAIAGFDQVIPLLNPSKPEMELAIFNLFNNRQKDDLLLLYFSGHGVKDQNGKLYFTSSNTLKDAVPATAIAATYIYDQMKESRAKRQVLILDCCFSGAFSDELYKKALATEDLTSDLRLALRPEGEPDAEGRVVLTSSNSYAFGQPNAELSVYTHYLIEGLATGAADQDSDGDISVDELHEYTRRKVQEASPAMKPQIFAVREGFKIKLARAKQGDPKLQYRKAVEAIAQESHGEIEAIDRRILDVQRRDLGISSEEASEIEAEILKPYQERQRKRQEYEEAWKDIIQQGALTDKQRMKLRQLQQVLRLDDGDVHQIESALPPPIIQPPVQPAAPQPPDPSPEPQPQSSIADSETSTISRQKFLRWAGLGGGGLVLGLVAIEVVQPQSSFPFNRHPIALRPFTFESVTVNEKGEETARRSGQAQSFKEDLGNGVELEMVSIPAGSFTMGSPENEKDRVADEGPQRTVNVPAFFMGKFAVTQAQWKAIAQLPKVKIDLKPDPSNFKGSNRPVETVSWNEAVEFCDRLSLQTGRSYRLPSEAEWEYACRAGTLTPFHTGATLTSKLANYGATSVYRSEPKGEYRQQTTPVGTFLPNAFGLYDMHGNVWEWCADHWHDNYQGAPIDGSAWMTGGNGDRRLIRGGSWIAFPRNCRSACRY